MTALALTPVQPDESDINTAVEALPHVKSYLADSKVFRPEILGRIDRVYVFQPLEGMVIAEIAILKLAKLGKEYGVKVQFVAPELLVQALIAGQKVSRFGVRELDRVIFDMFALQLTEAKENGVKEVTIDVGDDGNPRVTPVVPNAPSA